MFDKQARLNAKLLRAAKRGDETKALLALGQGAEIDCGKAKGTTPLVEAIGAGKWPMACLLVEKGADVHGAPPEQKTPLIQAVERGDAAIVRLLLEAGAAPDAVFTYTTCSEHEVEDDDGYFGFFRETYTVRNTHHVTALTLAAHDGKSEIVRLLLGAGANRELRGRDGRNALECAEASGHARVAALLRRPPDASPQKQQESADLVVVQRDLDKLFLEEIYDFAARERVSLIRARAAGPVETIVRDAFSDLADTAALRAAFNEHLRRGGTAPEREVFTRSLDKPRTSPPGNDALGKPQ